MHYNGKKYERGSNWSEPEVLELLQIWSSDPVQSELESNLRNQHVFNRIAGSLRQKGIYRTGDQCREKIKKLKLEYRRFKDKQKAMRCRRFYEVMDRVLGTRSSSSSSGTLPLWTGPVPNLAVGLPSVGSSSEEPGQPPGAGELLEVKKEDRSSDDEAAGSDPAAPPELLYEIEPDEDDEDDDGGVGQKPAGPDAEEQAGMDEEQGNTEVMQSPSDYSDRNMTAPSGVGASSATAPMAMRDDGSYGGQAGCGGSGSLRERKRRKAGRGDGAADGGQEVLATALAGYLSWQQTAEERFLALEEGRLQQEARAEERREQQEERRAQRDQEHEFRLMSMLARVLSSSRGTEDRGPARDSLQDPDYSLTSSPNPSSNRAKAPSVPSTLRGDQTRQYSRYLSRRGNSMRLQQGILQEGYAQYHANKYDENTNPDGIINMGTSENKLCFDLLQKRLTRPDMLHIDPAILQYPDWKGHSFLREEVAEFLSDFCCSPRPLKAENVVVMNGCGSIFSALAAVICDPEDVILIPSPFYGAITEDVSLYSSVRLHHVPLDSEPTGGDVRPFQLTVEKLKNSLKEARKEGRNVRALILLNPHNPLGEVYSSEEMISFLTFAKTHELHVIVDEIYMLSVFGKTETFSSVLSLDRLPDPQRTHIMWGVSKDFAMAGVRVGMVYSANRDLFQALDQLGFLHGVPGPTQYQMAQLLRDRDWLNGEFLPENRRRLREAHSYVTAELKKLGIPYLHTGAGFFIWADFSKYLKDKTFEEELSLWRCFIKHRVLLSCSRAFHCVSPGWFRIIFSDQLHKLKLGVQRMRKALEELHGSSLHESQETTEIKQDDSSSVKKDTKKDTTKDESKDKTVKASNIPNKEQRHTDSSNTESISSPAEDFVFDDSQSAANSDSLSSLIGTLRQQIHSSDWLEKNKPELAAGADPTQLDVFTDLLDRARK